MTILVTGDIHLNDVARDAYRHDFFADHLPKIIREHQVKTLIIAGDLTDDKDCHGAWLVNQLLDHLTFLAREVQIIVLMGNHDYIDVENPFFEILRHIPNITWIGKPRLIFREGINFLFLPHTHDYKKDWTHSYIAVDYVIAHQTFEGATGDSGFKLKGIPTDVFPTHVKVLSGDIHTPQTFGNITYIGPPYTIDFGDTYAPRLLLLRPGKEPHSIACPGPQKRLVCLGRDGTGIEGEYKKGDIVKIRVKISAADHAEWPRIKQEAQKWGEAQKLTVHQVVPEVIDKGAASSAARRAREGAKTDGELLQTYGRVRRVSKETIDTGLRLINDA